MDLFGFDECLNYKRKNKRSIYKNKKNKKKK